MSEATKTPASVESVIDQLCHACHIRGRIQAGETSHGDSGYWLALIQGFRNNLLERLAGQSGERWRPIDSAPKDGTRLWLFWPGCGPDDSQSVGWWHESIHGCWWMDHADTERQDPTHWMPLPAPPVSSSVAAQPEKEEGATSVAASPSL